jgi:superfamily I DNA/RNA helicase
MDVTSSCMTLNKDQLDIVKYVTASVALRSVPLIVFGAFGTGKTETLAQAAVKLSKCGGSEVRTLICTHTNRLLLFVFVANVFRL